MTARLPDILIGGTEKGGTTWLQDVMAAHPDLYFPDVKELHFFNAFDSNLNRLDAYERLGLEGYAKTFATARQDQLIGEATPLYLSDPEAPARIANALPHARVIFLLRDPVSRAWSHYRMAHAKQHVTEPLETLIDAYDERFFERGFYAKHLARWLKLMGPNQCLIAFYEDVAKDPAQVLVQIADWLDISPYPFLEADPERRRNAATGYKSPGFYNASVKLSRRLRSFPITRPIVQGLKAAGVYDALKSANRQEAEALTLAPETEARLTDIFREDASRLPGLLGETPPWPRYFSRTTEPAISAPKDPAQPEPQATD